MSLSDSVHSEAQDVVIQVGVPAVELATVPVALGPVSLDCVDHLAHRQDDPAHLHQLLTHAVGPLLDLAGHCVVVKETVLKVLDRVVHQLDCLEMAVHDDVQQAVKQRPWTELEQLGVVLPTLHHLVDVEIMVEAHSHDAAGHDER
jgi:hypothetical protein